MHSGPVDDNMLIDISFSVDHGRTLAIVPPILDPSVQVAIWAFVIDDTKRLWSSDNLFS